jgi:hypothetical protein
MCFCGTGDKQDTHFIEQEYRRLLATPFCVVLKDFGFLQHYGRTAVNSDAFTSL